MSTVQGGQGSIITSGLVFNLDIANPRSYAPPYNNTTIQNAISTSSNISGSLINGPTYSGSNGGVITLDGTNDYIDCGNATALQITGSLTIENWVYLTSLTNSNDLNLFSKYSNAGGTTNQGWILFKATTDYASYGPGGSGGPANNEFAWLATSNGNFSGALIGTGEQVVANTWYQVVGVFNSNTNTLQIYINGVLKRSAVRTGQTAGVLLNAARNVLIGATPEDGARRLQGRMSVARLYNRALEATEVLQNFNATRARFNI